MKYYIYICLILFSCSQTSQFVNYDDYHAIDVIQAYNNMLEGIDRFYGESSMSTTAIQNGKVESFDVSADISWTERDSFAIQTSVTFLNLNAFDLFIGKEHYVFKGRSSYFRGLKSDNFINQMAKIPVPLDYWFPLFAGKMELPESGFESHIESDGRLRVVYENLEVYFRKDAFLPDIINYYDSNHTLMMVYSTKGIVKSGAFIFPKSIQLIDKKNQSEILVNYSNITVNKPIDPDKFEIKIPANLEQFKYE